jgi:hypothetical protein
MLLWAKRLWIALCQTADDGERGQLRLSRHQIRIELTLIITYPKEMGADTAKQLDYSSHSARGTRPCGPIVATLPAEVRRNQRRKRKTVNPVLAEISHPAPTVNRRGNVGVDHALRCLYYFLARRIRLFPSSISQREPANTRAILQVEARATNHVMHRVDV